MQNEDIQAVLLGSFDGESEIQYMHTYVKWAISQIYVAADIIMIDDGWFLLLQVILK